MSAGTPNITADREDITLRQHVIDRWELRIAVDDPQWFGADLKALFVESVDIELANIDDRGALHRPSGGVFIYEELIGGWTVIRTVYHESTLEYVLDESGGQP